jgi:hypothetical protein
MTVLKVIYSIIIYDKIFFGAMPLLKHSVPLMYNVMIHERIPKKFFDGRIESVKILHDIRTYEYLNLRSSKHNKY